MSNPETTAMADRLAHATFLDLFQRLDHKLLDNLWNGGRARDELEAVVRDPEFSASIRFLGAEILFTMDPAWPPSDAVPVLASVYAVALSDAPKDMANPWGLPGMTHALTADHVLRLGSSAVAALRPLLDDSAPVRFAGSREATYGNRFGWRVKDIAASLIARIRGVPFDPDPDPSVRDSEIVHLKAGL